MQTQVYVGVMRPPQPSELWGAVSKRPYCWIGEITTVGEPLEATHSRGADWCGSRNFRKGTAIGARTARIRPGRVRCPVNGHRPAGAERENRANRPTSDHCIYDLVGVFSQ